MKALRVLCDESLGSSTTDVGRVVRRDQLPKNLEDTILDKKILREGGSVRLPEDMLLVDLFNRPVKRADLPGLSHNGQCEELGDIVLIHPAAAAFNDLLIALERRDARTKDIESALHRYQMELVLRLMGARGIVANAVASVRTPLSGRLVLLPSTARHPAWVGICAGVMKSAGVEEGDYVLCVRDPVIHIGSVEILRAYPVERDTIEIHPLVYDQFAADNDGDQVAFVKLDMTKPDVAKEAKEHLLAYCKANSKWPQRLCTLDPETGERLPSEVDWEDPLADGQRRFAITGASYGPRDVRGWQRIPEAVIELERLAGSKEPEKGTKFAISNSIIATGDDETIWQIIHEANTANVFMKRYLGVVGATARRILLVAGDDSWLRGAANRISDTIQQDTLDAKHGDIKDKLTLPVDIMEMFMMRGRWRDCSLQDCVELLKSASINEEDARRMIMYHRVELPMVLMSETNLKRPENVERMTRLAREAIQADDGNARDKYNLVIPIKEFCKLLKAEGGPRLDPHRAFKEARGYRKGLLAMVKAFYPQFASLGKTVTGDYEASLAFYCALFQEGTRDRGGLFPHLRPLKEVTWESSRQQPASCSPASASESESMSPVASASA